MATAPADDDANHAVVELLAATLGIPRGRLWIARGRSRQFPERLYLQGLA
jgi:uncharacterized protein YggU (UPF0235/DUF167 family)